MRRRRKSCSDREDLSGRVLLYIATFSPSKLLQTPFLSRCVEKASDFSPSKHPLSSLAVLKKPRKRRKRRHIHCSFKYNDLYRVLLVHAE